MGVENIQSLLQFVKIESTGMCDRDGKIHMEMIREARFLYNKYELYLLNSKILQKHKLEKYIYV